MTSGQRQPGLLPPRPHVVVLAGNEALLDALFPEPLRARLTGLAEAQFLSCTAWEEPVVRQALSGADVLVAGWGAPLLGQAELDDAPRLRAVLHAGGWAGSVVDLGEAARHRLALSDAGDANAEPVAEFTLSAILAAGKDLDRSVRIYRERQAFIDREAEFPQAGNYRRTVGIVGASRIGRRVLQLLRPFDLEVLLSDPTITPEEAAPLGARHVKLDELLRRSDIVSLHVPVTEQTKGMIGAGELALLQSGATLINTSRGAVLDQEALVEEIRNGRLKAILDVTEPDPLPAGHPLFTLPGVVLTPHMAGAVGLEISRLGEFVLAELERLLQGRELHGGAQYAGLRTPVAAGTGTDA